MAPPLYRQLTDRDPLRVVPARDRRPARVYGRAVSASCPRGSTRATPRAVSGPTRPLVVAVGRLVPVKNFPRLIAILARVHDKIPALETVIVGEGRERSSLEAMLHDLGAESYVSLPGRLSAERARRALPPGLGGRLDLDREKAGD